MTNKKFSLLLVLILFGWSAAAIAQPAPNITGQITSTGNKFYTADILKLSESSIGGSAGNFFILTITNADGLKLKLEFKKDGTPLAVGQTGSAFVGDQTRTITNNNIGRGDYRLKGFKINESAFKNTLGENLNQSGGISVPTLLPNGLYEFVFSLVNSQGTDVASTTLTLNINNLSGYITLVYPGVSTSLGLVEDIYTFLPTFQWQGTADGYEISVWEQLPNQENFNEVKGNNPHIFEKINTPSFQYRPSEDRALVAGKTYFWQIKAFNKVIARQSSEETLSEPFVFRVSEKLAGETGSGVPAEVQLQRIKDMLNDMGISPDWLKDAGFVSFSGKFSGNSYQNNTDLNMLVQLLEQMAQDKAE